MIGLNDPALGKSSRLGSAERCAFRDRRLFDQQKSSVFGRLPRRLMHEIGPFVA